MTLRTTADAIQVRCPDCPENEAGFFHGVGYGSSFGSVNAGTNDLGGAHFSGSGAERSYALTGAGCGTMGTASGWTRYTAPAAGTPPATAGVVDAGVLAWLAGCEVPCCGSFEPPAVVQKQGYRFGFNGQEKDDEIYGATGTSYTAEFWQYDPRVGRRWNLDPVDKPWQSRYHAFSNNPIAKIDPNGAKDDWVERDGEVVWDENVQGADSPNLQSGDRYLGKEGFGFEDGLMTHYQKDGTKRKSNVVLSEVEIIGKRPSFIESAWNKYELGLIHIEASFEIAIPGVVEYGGSVGLVADAKNNLGFTMTKKELAGPSAGFAVGLNSSYVHRSFTNQVTINDLQGFGREYGLGLLGASGFTAWPTDGPNGGRRLPSQGGYNTYGGGVWGTQLDIGYFNWNTQTTVKPLFNGLTPLW